MWHVWQAFVLLPRESLAASLCAYFLELPAVNLGQGFPNWPTPDFVKQAASEAVMADFNQYSRSQGHLNLTTKLAEM